MKAIVQRVLEASVVVDGETVGAIGPGAIIYLGVFVGDTPVVARRLATKIAQFRFFPDASGRMGSCALDFASGDSARSILVVSQFTLAADGRKGRRPSFDAAERPDRAEALYWEFCECLSGMGLRVATGRFGAMMQVHQVGDGPVTFALEMPPLSSAATEATA